MKLLMLALLAAVSLAACLPNVSRDISEPEARAILEREVLNLCKDSRSTAGLSTMLHSIDTAEAVPSKDHWAFHVTPESSVGELEALVFPSRIVSGSYIRHVQTRSCR